MPIYRSRPKVNFTAIKNVVIRDIRLKGEDRGLLLWLLSHAPHWKVIVSVIMKNMGWGRDKTYKILNRLILIGYVERHQDRDDRNGSFGEVVYTVRDQPVVDTPLPETPFPENGKAAKERNIKNKKAPPTPSTSSDGDSFCQKAPSFGQFWSAYRPDSFMSRHDTERRWNRMTQIDRSRALDGVFRYLADCEANRRKRVGAPRYLQDRIWEGYAAKKLETNETIHPNSLQWTTWRAYRAAIGEPTSFMDARAREGKVLTVPSEWPPDVTDNGPNMIESGKATTS
jgi:hypothetical protein